MEITIETSNYKLQIDKKETRVTDDNELFFVVPATDIDYDIKCQVLFWATDNELQACPCKVWQVQFENFYHLIW